MIIESYNQLVNAVYLANVSTLQAAYAIDATNNYLNYVNYLAASAESSIALAQICPLEGGSPTPDNSYNTINFYVRSPLSTCSNGQSTTLYYPNGYSNGDGPVYVALTPQNAESAFVFAQEQLTNLYARRINLLYTQMISYLYSDPAYPKQGINLVYGETALSSNMTTIIESPTAVKTLSSTFGQVIGGAWNQDANLYQYPITNLDISLSKVESYINQQLQQNSNQYPVMPPINNSNYLPVYQNIQNGYYDGQSIAAYNNTMSAANSVFDFTQYCETADNELFFWSNGSQLACNTWSIADIYSIGYNSGQSSFNFQLANGVIPTPGFIPSEGNFSVMGGNFQVAGHEKNGYHIYNNSNSIVPVSAWQLINGNNNFYNQSTATQLSLYDGGYSGNGQYHTAGIQVTLPNGFNRQIRLKPVLLLMLQLEYPLGSVQLFRQLLI
jgi:hypothetical protein